MTQSPRITVVIPHYGDVGTTQRLLRDLAAQTGVGTLPVVVVDDASPERFRPTDVPMPEEAPAEGSEQRGPDRAEIRVEVVQRDSNGGFGSAVNTGLARVGTPWALVLNTDLELPPDVVERLDPERLPETPAVVAPRVVGTDGAPQWVGRRFPTVGQQAIEWLTPLARFRDSRRWHEAVGHDTASAGSGTRPVDWVMGAAMLLPVEAVREVGGFDERFFMNGEEVDLQRRLREAGVRSWVLGDVEVRHLGGGSSDPLRRRRWLVASRFRYARKWGGEARLRAALRAATLVNFCHQLLRRAAGREVAPWRVLREEWSLTGLDERGGNA